MIELFKEVLLQEAREKKRLLWPLHTRAKSRDHEIVRAQKKVSKGRPNTPPKSCSVLKDARVSCEVICYRPSTESYFNEISIHVGLHA